MQTEIKGNFNAKGGYSATHQCRDGGQHVSMLPGIDPTYFVGHCSCGEKLICRGFNFIFPCEKKEKIDARKKVRR